MKRIAVLMLATCLFGCDDSTTPFAAPTAPPTCAGQGTVYIFQSKNGMGTKFFHKSLNQFIAASPDLKLVSIVPIDIDAQSEPQRYLVIMSGGGKDPVKITEPSVMPLEK
jgi:hypothetical protein